MVQELENSPLAAQQIPIDAMSLASVCKCFASKQFLLYIFFGGSAAVVNLSCGYLLYSYTTIPFPISVFLASSMGLFVNFLLNYYYNFKYSGRPMHSQMGTFLVVSMFGTMLTTVLAWCVLWLLSLANMFVAKKFLAQFISVGLVTFYSFIAHKFLTFNTGIIANLKKIRKRNRQCEK